MYLLTDKAVLVCDHTLGRVMLLGTGQNLVTIEDRPVLVEDDPERKKIAGCPNMGATIKPCQHTLAVKAGYSDLIRIEDQRVCLDTLSGPTDGTPPGMVNYTVKNPGQRFVSERD